MQEVSLKSADSFAILLVCKTEQCVFFSGSDCCLSAPKRRKDSMSRDRKWETGGAGFKWWELTVTEERNVGWGKNCEK